MTISAFSNLAAGAVKEPVVLLSVSNPASTQASVTTQEEWAAGIHSTVYHDTTTAPGSLKLKTVELSSYSGEGTTGYGWRNGGFCNGDHYKFKVNDNLVLAEFKARVAARFIEQGTPIYAVLREVTTGNFWEWPEISRSVAITLPCDAMTPIGGNTWEGYESRNYFHGDRDNDILNPSTFPLNIKTSNITIASFLFENTDLTAGVDYAISFEPFAINSVTAIYKSPIYKSPVLVGHTYTATRTKAVLGVPAVHAFDGKWSEINSPLAFDLQIIGNLPQSVNYDTKVVDFGSTDPFIFEADDSRPPNTTISYTLYGGNTADYHDFDALGVITDGTEFAGGYRYYYIHINFTTTGVSTPIVDEIRFIAQSYDSGIKTLTTDDDWNAGTVPAGLIVENGDVKIDLKEQSFTLSDIHTASATYPENSPITKLQLPAFYKSGVTTCNYTVNKNGSLLDTLNNVALSSPVSVSGNTGFNVVATDGNICFNSWYVNGLLYAAPSYHSNAYTDGLIVSEDGGATWEPVYITNSVNYISLPRAVVYGGGKYLICAGTGKYYLSNDGKFFTEYTLPNSMIEALSGCYDRDTFVIFATDTSATSKYLTSTDGINWTVYTATFSSSTPSSMGVFNGYIYHSQSNAVYRSNNKGQTWTTVTSTFSGMTASKQSAFLVSQNKLWFLATGKMYSSVDGLNWSALGTVGDTTSHNFAFDGSKFYVGSSTVGVYYTSTDGNVWVQRSLPDATHWARSFAYTSLGLVIIGSPIQKLVGTTLTILLQSVFQANNNSNGKIQIAEDPDNPGHIMYAVQNKIFYSADFGVTSRLAYTISTTSETVQGMCCGGGKWVALSSGKFIYTSVDNGLTWTATSKTATWAAASLYYSSQIVYDSEAGQFLFSISDGTNSYLYTSPDGVTLTQRLSYAGYSSLGMAACFIIAGGTYYWAAGPHFYKSTTYGTSWTTVSNAYAAKVAVSVAYINGKQIVGTASGDIYQSSDATTFTLKASVGVSVSNLCVIGNTVYAWAGYGSVYVSTDNGGTWNLLEIASNSLSPKSIKKGSRWLTCSYYGSGHQLAMVSKTSVTEAWNIRPDGNTGYVNLDIADTTINAGQSLQVVASPSNYGDVILYDTCKAYGYSSPVTMTTQAIQMSGNANAKFELSADIPANTSLTLTAYRSGNGVDWVSLGAVVSGDVLTGDWYYKFDATFTSDGSATPTLHYLTVTGAVYPYIYFSTQRDVPVFGAMPYVQGISGVTSKLTPMSLGTVGEVSVDLAYTADVSDILYSGVLKNRKLSVSLGLMGLPREQYAPVLAGIWYDYSLNLNKNIATIKTRDVFQRFLKMKLPMERVGATFDRVTESITWSNVNVLQVVLDILDHCGVPDSLIDRTAFNTLIAGSRSGANWNVSRTLSKDDRVEVNKLLEELSIISGVFLIPHPNGKLIPVLYDSTANIDFSLSPEICTFGTIEGGQKDLYTRQQIYYDLLSGKKPSDTESDYGKLLLNINAEAEIKWNINTAEQLLSGDDTNSYSKTFFDKWGMSTFAREALAARMDSWYATPKMLMTATGVPPRFMDAVCGNVIGVSGLQLPVAKADFGTLCSNKKFLIIGKSLDTKNLSLSFDLMEI